MDDGRIDGMIELRQSDKPYSLLMNQLFAYLMTCFCCLASSFAR